MNVQYNVKTLWTAGRQGIISSDVLHDAITVATPPEFSNGVPGVWSPEHLFVAAASSCFMSTFLAIAEKSRLAFSKFSCEAIGILSDSSGSLMISQITLHPILEVANVESLEKGLKTLHHAHKACLVLNSMRSEIILAPQVVVSNQFALD